MKKYLTTTENKLQPKEVFQREHSHCSRTSLVFLQKRNGWVKLQTDKSRVTSHESLICYHLPLSLEEKSQKFLTWPLGESSPSATLSIHKQLTSMVISHEAVKPFPLHILRVRTLHFEPETPGRVSRAHHLYMACQGGRVRGSRNLCHRAF